MTTKEMKLMLETLMKMETLLMKEIINISMMKKETGWKE